MKQRGAIEAGAILLLVCFVLLAGFAFKYAIPFFSHEKNSQSLALQARLISLAITDDYLAKCSSGIVTQATWAIWSLSGWIEIKSAVLTKLR